MRIFSLDVPALRRRLHEAAQRLAEARPEVERVVLFGSLARGDALPGSDADLLVVLTSADAPFLARLPSYSRYLDGCGIGVDVFAYTEAELRHREAASPRWAAAVRDGHLLYERAVPQGE